MKRIYISGPCSELPDSNYPAFNAAAAALRAEGYHVESPAENPRQESWAAYMRVALRQMLTCQEVWLLPGWEQSSGAVWEASIAKGLGMPVKVVIVDTEGVSDFTLFSFEKRHLLPLPAPGALRRSGAWPNTTHRSHAGLGCLEIRRRGGAVSAPHVLDPCCGSRMWWFDKQDARVLFGDRRREELTVTDRSHGNESGTRTLRIDPDVEHDFRALPYADGTFRLVAFDPPHLVRAGPKSWLAAKYGKLSADWRDDLRAGFSECFRVLAPHGVLVFKWNETQIKVREVLALTDERPLFGNTSGKKAGTHWIVFMKGAA